MLKSTTSAPFGPFLVREPKKHSDYFKIQYKLFTTNCEGEVTLCDKVKDFIAFAGLDEEEVKKAFGFFIRPGSFNALKAPQTKDMKSLEFQFAKGVTQYLQGDVGIDNVSPLCVCGYLLAGAGELHTKSLTERYGIVRLAITDARVLYVIDNDEELFDAVGYLCGGEQVFKALITPERAARIPVDDMFVQVFVWCVVEGLIKLTKKHTLSKNIKASLLTEGIEVPNVDAELKKIFCVSNSGNGINWMLRKDATISEKDLSALAAPELAYLIKHNTDTVMKCTPIKYVNEALVLLRNIDDSDTYSRVLKRVNSDEIHKVVYSTNFDKITPLIESEDALMTFCKNNLVCLRRCDLVYIGEGLTDVKKLREIQKQIFPARLKSPVIYIDNILKRFN